MRIYTISDALPQSDFEVKQLTCFFLKPIGLLLFVFGLFSFPSFVLAAERIDPHACAWYAGKVSPADYEGEIERRITTPPPEDSAEYPYRLCIIAELMKRAGDSRASLYYEQAIELHPEEPALELIYGEYLQWMRGVRNGGLAVEAKEHYRLAQEKVTRLKEQDRWGARNDEKTNDDLKKALFYLNQENGIGLSFGGKEPFVFFSTITEARNDTVAFDYQWVDSRAFNAEALYSASRSNLNRPLTQRELKGIARHKLGVVTSNRLRVQLGKLRSIDLTYRYLRFNDAKIPNYRDPTRNVNDIGHEYGISFSNDFQLPYAIDVFLQAGAKTIRRTTSAEGFNDKKEDSQRYNVILGASRLIGPGKITGEFEFRHQVWDPGLNWAGINTYQGNLLYQTRLFGTNRWIFDGTYVFQDVDQSSFNPFNDNMKTLVAQATYVFTVPQFLRSHVGGGDVFAGYADSSTLIASQSQNEVKKRQFFAGFALRRVDLTPSLNPFDLTFRSSYYKSRVKRDSSQDHTQWRNELTFGYRLVENHEVQWIPQGSSSIQPALVSLEVPLRHDGSVEGLREFANYRVGLQVKGDFIFTRTTVPFPFYGTLGYALERFYHLKENFHIFLFRLGTGF
ncbi:MAG: hypothetical protein NPIRA05_13300 [Nitrospirales bacterium]|nr:MAG: hypothetical protein NPIRA05_13300 [Nitrospirales bacterium]